MIKEFRLCIWLVTHHGGCSPKVCVAIFISALYNLCKTYLGNSPILIAPKYAGSIEGRLNQQKNVISCPPLAEVSRSDGGG
jgi:hypothetical protein